MAARKRGVLKLACKNHSPFFPCLSSNSLNRIRNDPHSKVPELAIHASMYGIADKYGIQGLKSISTQNLKATLQHRAWTSDSQQHYSSCMIHNFIAAIQAAWNSTPESDKGVRAPLLDHAWKIRKVLLEAEDFKLVMRQIHEFTWDLFAQTLKY